MDEGAAAAVRKAVAMAKRGDRAMLRLVVERCVPKAGRLAEGQAAAGPVSDTGTLLDRVRALVDGVAAGEITIEEARERGKLLELERRTLETCELAERLERIEAGLQEARKR